MTKPKAVAAEYKRERVKKLVDLISKYQIIATADLTSLPSLQLQKMRSNLKGIASIKLDKIALIRLAFDKIKSKYPGVEKLTNNMKGRMVALVLTNENPFKLAKIVNDAKISAAAKPGQISPGEIKIPAGPTAFPPGPVISDLGKVGLKTGVEGGKITIKEDKVVAVKDDVISKDLAVVLAKLNIEPMEIGINLVSAYEAGTVFDADILSVDEEEYINKIKTAVTEAFNLSFNTAYPTKETIALLIKKAHLDSAILADERDILTSENVAKILGKAERQAHALKSKTND
jgi:large subunit ribosomal protein L10